MHTNMRNKMPMRTLLAIIGLVLMLTASLGTVVSAAPAEAPMPERYYEMHYEMHDEAGVLIVSVVSDSPADEAGLVRGDIVLAVDGEAMNNAESFAAAITTLSVGEEIVLTVLHGDDTLELPTVLGERSGRTFLGVVPYVENPEGIDVEGGDVDNAAQDDDEDASQSNDDDGDALSPQQMLRSFMPFELGGAMVADVVDGGPADEAGLVVGDIIVAVDGEALTTGANLAELIGSRAPGDEVVLTIHNIESNATMEIPITLAAHPDDEEKAFLGIAYTLTPVIADLENDAVDEDASEMAEDDDEAIGEEDDEDVDSSQGRRAQGSQLAQGGAMVMDVVDGSPADEAGLVAGDLIVAVDGEELGEGIDLAELIGSFAPGDEVLLTIYNAESNETMELPVTLGAYPDDEGRAFLGIAYAIAPVFAPQNDDSSRNEAPAEDEAIGETEEESDEADKVGEEELKEEEERDDDAITSPRRQQRETNRVAQGGVKIVDVVDGGPADDAGLMPGDVIVAVDGEALADDANLGDLIGSYSPGDEVVLTVFNIDPRETAEVPVTLGAHPDDETKAFLGVAYGSAPIRAPGSLYQRGPAPMDPDRGEKPKSEDDNGCFHGNSMEDHEGFHGRYHGKEGYEGHAGCGEHGGMMMPFFHHGMGGHGLKGFDFNQLSEEDLEALQEMFPFRFPDGASESE
jgi:S1-C subfamily serine protease